MIEKDLGLAKTTTVERCLKRIEHTTAFKPERLDNLNAQDIFMLNLQRLL